MTESLVRRAGAGERDAIARILDILHGELAALIRRANIHVNDRDDAAQDAVLVVMACLSSYNPALGTFRAYVHVSVRKMLLKFRRPGPALLAKLPDLSYESSAAGVDASDALTMAPNAEIVRDYYGIGRDQELSINQIAARRKMAPKRVREALTEALQVMREAS